MKTQPILSASDAAKILGVTSSRVRQLAISGDLAGATKIGGIWLFHLEAVKNFTRRKRGPRPGFSISKYLAPQDQEVLPVQQTS